MCERDSTWTLSEPSEGFIFLSLADENFKNLKKKLKKQGLRCFIVFIVNGAIIPAVLCHGNDSKHVIFIAPYLAVIYAKLKKMKFRHKTYYRHFNIRIKLC